MNFQKIYKIHTKNFRNLNSTYEFSPNINCIFGFNGTGKTNLLESVYYLIKKKSFRKNTDFAQILSIDANKPEIIFQSLIKSDEEIYTYSGKLLNDSEEWYLNNEINTKKISLSLFMVNPHDSNMFHIDSTFRRDFINNLFGNLNKEFKTKYKNYQSYIRMRNKLLSEENSDLIQIKSLDNVIIPLSFELIKLKTELIKKINSEITDIFQNIFSERHILELELKSDFKDKSLEEINASFSTRLDKDKIIGHTTHGIHRDDILFKFDGFNGFDFCSLGQQKMSFFALIFSFIELQYKMLGEYPIILLDDVSGELDSLRWKNLIEYLSRKNFQVLITTANDAFRNELSKYELVKLIELGI
jgi:DNA replication and repair protein RecF